MKTRDLIAEFIDKSFGLCASNLHSVEGKLINYNTIIAQWFDDTLLINTTKYSVTTSKHQNQLLRLAEYNGIRYYTVDGISIRTNDLSYLYHG